MFVRSANREDAQAVVALLRRSILELCVADHGNNPIKVEGWLENKTEDRFAIWLNNDQLIKAVAVRDGEIAGFGMATVSGEILLNYVSPDHRFGGVSTAILSSLEESLAARGVKELVLSSTETAHAFYLARGWRDHGAPTVENGMKSYPMKKSLGA